MKCPKCSYVGYEATDRCRHCGYDFSLVAATAVAAAPASTGRMEPVPFPVVALERERPTPEPSPDEADLPLQSAPLDTAEFTPPPAGAPLAVRRTTERIRARSSGPAARRPRPALLDAATEPDAAEATAPEPEAAADVSAPPAARLLSAVIDGALIAGIDASVVYLTAKIANIPLADVASLPLAPLATFLLGLNIAYLAVFTANGGQTLGKMAVGLRVEGTHGPVSFGDASVRVVIAIVGGLAAGAGFLPALWRQDRRAVHDQIANTRVVKVLA